MYYSSETKQQRSISNSRSYTKMNLTAKNGYNAHIVAGCAPGTTTYAINNLLSKSNARRISSAG